MMIIRTKGSPSERGRQQGEAGRDIFKPWMEYVLEAWRLKSGAASEADLLRNLAATMHTYWLGLQQSAPALAEEVQSLALGLDVKFERYLAALSGWQHPDFTAGCTTIGFHDEKHHPVLGKTDDLHRNELGKNIVEITCPDKGLRHVHFHFAGTIWTIAGMNKEGLAMAMTGIPGRRIASPGLTSLDALHTILPVCRTVGDALDHVRALPLSNGGFSLILGDAGGKIAIVEKTPAGMAILNAENDIYAHTNHILDPDFAGQNPPQNEPLAGNSLRRLARVRNGLGDRPRSIDILRELLREGSPRGIWQDGDAGMFTDFAAIFMPAQKKVEFWSRDAGGAQCLNLKDLWD